MADPKVAAGSRYEDEAMRVEYANRIDRPLPLTSLQIGRVHILDLPGECLVDYQRFAQGSAPDDFVAVAAYTDLGPGYICTDKAFQEGGYEPTVYECRPRLRTVVESGNPRTSSQQFVDIRKHRPQASQERF